MTFLPLLGLGLTVGVVSGVLGIGGGVLLVPALMTMFAVEDFRRASGLSLVALVLPVTLPGALRYYYQGSIRGEDLLLGLWIALGMGVGTWLGAHIAWVLPVQSLRTLFGLLLIFVAVRFLLTSDGHAYAAFYGLLGVALAWCGFVVLRVIGRRNRARPRLSDHMRPAPAPPEPGDYSI